MAESWPLTASPGKEFVVVRPGSLAEDVARLPWLPPTPAALLALAQSDDCWSAVRSDPGAVTLLLRIPSLRKLAPELLSLPELTRNPEPLERAAQRLRANPAVTLPDWSAPARTTVRTAALRYANIAAEFARMTGRCDPEKAWVCGLLAPLGWLAIAAVRPGAIAEVFDHPNHAGDPETTQRDHWGLDHAALGRRLARRWELPQWLAGTIGYLGMPLEIARRVGADPVLFQVTQLAVAQVQSQGHGLKLTIEASPTQLLASLGLNGDAIVCSHVDDQLRSRADAPNLHDLLFVAAENRRLRTNRNGEDLERLIDALSHELQEQRGREDEKLRAQKLRALAEFAAGAGHEINNPLAVISGQAQYLLGGEEDAERRKSLETIVGQAQRIHQLLRNVMHFARPPAPKLQPTDLIRMVDEVATSLAESAAERNVRLRVRETEETPDNDWPRTAVTRQTVLTPLCMVRIDPAQVRTALTCMIKNAIEAAPEDGWTSVRVARVDSHVEVIVEDSGPPLSAVLREHLFDPFFSGRSAGRGVGLGLPTAWSLVRQQGGDIFLASESGEPTRFVLRLPLMVDSDSPRSSPVEAA